MAYPKWKYHKTEAPKIVESEEQEKSLGEAWGETPAAFIEDAPTESPLMKLKEDELIEMLKDSGLKPSTLKRRTKEQLVKMIEEKS